MMPTRTQQLGLLLVLTIVVVYVLFRFVARGA